MKCTDEVHHLRRCVKPFVGDGVGAEQIGHVVDEGMRPMNGRKIARAGEEVIQEPLNIRNFINLRLELCTKNRRHLVGQYAVELLRASNGF